jgi:hypothetical protein
MKGIECREELELAPSSNAGNWPRKQPPSLLGESVVAIVRELPLYMAAICAAYYC